MKTLLSASLLAIAVIFHALWTDDQRFSEKDEAIIHENAVRLAFEIQNNNLELKDVSVYIDPDNKLPEHIEREVLLRAILTEMEQLDRK